MDPQTHPRETHSGASAPATAAGGRRVVALVDDDRNILTTVSIALQAEGFETRVYSDGETALRALTDNPPDLAVFDIKMPRMDGMELLAKLRERSALPVIFLTSKDDERDEEAGFQMGADDYISKPFSLRLLVARIRAQLEEVVVRVPVADGRAIAAIYREAEVIDRSDENTQVLLTARIPAPLLGRLRNREGVQVEPVTAS